MTMHDIRERASAIVRALQHRNFRLFFAGQSISLIGTWMQRVALGWLVYRLTDSAFLLGLVSFAGQIPVLFFGSFGGVSADRWNKHRLVILMQVLSMIQALILAALVLTNSIQVWHMIVLSVMLGTINAFEMPIRQAFFIQMIDEPKDLGNAIALNSSMVNAARLIGPSVAGLLIAAVGEGICFLLNGLSYIAVIISLVVMRVPKQQTKPHEKAVWSELKEGIRYAAGFRPIRDILLLLSVMSMMGLPYLALMPIFARDILHGGPDTLGYLMGATGVGALVGALYLASRKSVLGLVKLIAIASATFGAAIAAFAFSTNQYLSMTLLLFVGFGQITQWAGSNTFLQTIVDEDKRGRIMSLYVMAILGLGPVGSLVAGSLASRFGAPLTICIGGLTCLLGGLIFLRRLPQLRTHIRPVYEKMGIGKG